MDLLQNVRLISIPSWVKHLIAAMLVALFIFNIYVGYGGIFSSGKENWAEAAINLMGVLLPIIILGILLGFSHSGIDALNDKTLGAHDLRAST